MSFITEDNADSLCENVIKEYIETNKLAKDFTIMTISSYEVDSRLFKLSEGKILMQTSRSMATRTRINCTRNWITKSFVNMASKQSNLAFTTERNQYWAQVHLCGIPIKTKKNYFTILIRNLLNRIFNLLKLKKFELTISTENLVPKSDYDSYSYSDILTRPAPNQLRFLHYRIPSYDLKKNGDLFDMDYHLHR
jgi:hypothetical protein